MKMPHQFAAGDKNCSSCKKPLPAVDSWPGRSFFYCDEPECRTAAIDHPRRKFIEAGTVQCMAPDCTNFVPEGSYDPRHSTFVCSISCWNKRQAKGCAMRTCACCGLEYMGSERPTKTGLYFFSSVHRGRYQTAQSLDRCGVLRPVLEEYLDGFAKLRYRKVRSARQSLVPFFLFANQHNIKSISEIDTSTINKYLVWGLDTNRRQVSHSISMLKTFFYWAVSENRHPGPNPVVSELHAERKQERVPRPLEEEDMKLLWKILESRGTARLRYAAALAEEAGLRGGEVANVRLSDINLRKQQVFVRLPNKAMRERFSFFGEKTIRYYKEWMAERKDCEHDHVLHNKWRRPTTADSLREEFIRILCKQPGDEREGFDRWSTHRLRHTFASRLLSGGADASTIMTAGGWKSFGAMAGYARPDESQARRGYDRAMQTSHEMRKAPSSDHPLSLAEFLERKSQNT
jgi:integrase/recombinase XerC